MRGLKMRKIVMFISHQKLHVGSVVSAGGGDVDGSLLLVAGQDPDLDAGLAQRNQSLFNAFL
jgi:hypothetical protein